jgi:capreomycidine synthase
VSTHRLTVGGRASGASEVAPDLESWYRTELSRGQLDLSSSGVWPYSLRELRRLIGVETSQLDRVVLEDSVSLGSPRLRQAIAARYAPHHVEWVMATHGSSEAISLLMRVLLREADRVVVLDPIYHSLRTHAEQRGCRVRRVDVDAFVGEAATGWRRAIPPDTDVVVVNFPHNPTGQVLSAEDVDRLVHRCNAVGATLVWDGAMEELPMTSDARSSSPTCRDNVIRFGTLSKAFGLPGLRVGWCIAPPALLQAAFAERDRTTLFLSPLIELIAALAIENADVLIAPRLAHARRNLDRLDAWIDEHSGAVTWQRPKGGVCGLMQVRGSRDTESFCRRVLAATGVLLVPGKAFDRPGAVRIGYGGPPAAMGDGLERLSRFLRTDDMDRTRQERDHGATREGVPLAPTG